jgi:hypothetical protein
MRGQGLGCTWCCGYLGHSFITSWTLNLSFVLQTTDFAKFPVDQDALHKLKKEEYPNTLNRGVIDGQWKIIVNGQQAMFEGIGRNVVHDKNDHTKNEIGWLHFYDNNGRESRPAVMCTTDKHQIDPNIVHCGSGVTVPLARCV